MKTKSRKLLSLLLSCALLCALVVAAPVTAQAATDLVVDGTTGHTWADVAPSNSITLHDGDVLNIAEAAGSPAVSTTINIAADADVTINGSGAMVTNLHISEGADTVAHTVTLSNLQLTPGGSSRAYYQSKGVINLSGVNKFSGGALYPSGSASAINVTSSSGGSLEVDSPSEAAINAPTLNIKGNAQVTALSGTGVGVFASSLNIDSGASLAATAQSGAYVSGLQGNPLVIANNGTLIATGSPTNGDAIYSNSTYSLTMGAGAVTTFVSHGPGNDTYAFNMAPSVPAASQWELSGAAAFGSGNSATSDPAYILFPAGSTGTVSLKAGCSIQTAAPATGSTPVATDNSSVANATGEVYWTDEDYPSAWNFTSNYYPGRVYYSYHRYTAASGRSFNTSLTEGDITFTHGGTIVAGSLSVSPSELDFAVAWPRTSGTSASVAIDSQPAPLTTQTAGAISATLAVGATLNDGTGQSLTYLWYRSDSNDNSVGYLMSGETNPTFAIPATLVPGIYYYFCEVGAPGATRVRSSVAKVVVQATLPAAAAAIANQVYTGTAIKPAPVIKDGSKTLVNGSDFTLAYANNTAVGTATITVTGIGAYTGTTTVNFKIVPATPVLASLANSTTGPLLKWNKAAGATGYNVLRKTGTGGWVNIKTIAAAATVSYTDTTAVSGTTYSYSVQAYGGASSLAGSYNTTGLKIIWLATPKLTSAVNAATGVKFTWGKVSGATGYLIYRKTGTGTFVKVKTITSAATVSWIDTTTKSGTTYTYTAYAYKTSATNVSACNATGKKVVYVATPKLVSLANSKSGPVFKWGKVTGATGYIVYRKTTGGWVKLATIKSGSTVSYTDKKAVKGKTYSYTVRAYKTSTANISAYNTTGKKIKVKK